MISSSPTNWSAALFGAGLVRSSWIPPLPCLRELPTRNRQASFVLRTSLIWSSGEWEGGGLCPYVLDVQLACSGVRRTAQFQGQPEPDFWQQWAVLHRQHDGAKVSGLLESGGAQVSLLVPGMYMHCLKQWVTQAQLKGLQMNTTGSDMRLLN